MHSDLRLDEGRRLAAILREIVGAAIPLVTLGGLAGYVWLRYSYAQFYRDFGLSLEQVGFGYADVFTRSSGAIIFVLGWPFVAVALNLFAGYLALQDGSRKKDKVGSLSVRAVVRERPLSVLALTRPQGRLNFLVLLLIALEAITGPRWWIVGAAMGCWLLVLLFAVRRVGLLRLWAQAISVFIIAAGIALPAIQLVASSARRMALEVRAGTTPSALDFAGVPMLDVRVVPVRIEWLGEEPTAQLNDCLMYLGSSEGHVILFDFIRERTRLVSQSRALVTLQSREVLPSSCTDRAFDYSIRSSQRRVCRQIRLDSYKPRVLERFCRGFSRVMREMAGRNDRSFDVVMNTIKELPGARRFLSDPAFLVEFTGEYGQLLVANEEATGARWRDLQRDIESLLSSG